MSLSPRENSEAVLHGRQPDYYGNFMESMKVVADPIWKASVGPHDGSIYKDSWGVSYRYPPDSIGAMPVVTTENAVIQDITRWREQVTIPPVEGHDWAEAKAAADAIDRSEYYVGFLCAGGLFERSHFLMGMTEAFIAYMEEPEAMSELLRAIADFKIASIRETAAQIHPDVCFYQDDWGSKQNLFLPPDMWRQMIKPLQQEIADTIHECGMLYMHHADCICEPIVEDMVELGVDLWQSVIPQNDIVSIQKRTQGKLAMHGGIDGPLIDVDSATEDEIRAEVRRAIDAYCPAGRFFPALSPSTCYHGWIQEVYLDELATYGRRWAEEHPVDTMSYPERDIPVVA